MTAPFRLPKFGPEYIDRIVSRTESLIHSHIWEGFDQTRLRQWLSNFATEEDRYFSTCILDSLIYRSPSQTIALSQQLFQRSLPDLARTDPPPIPPISDWNRQLRGDIDPQIRLVPVIKERDPPTKSGFIISRLLKRHLHVREEWIVNPDEVSSLASRSQVFLLIDDFLGTGDQLSTFLRSSAIFPLLSSHYVIYATLAAHDDGVTAVSASFPELRLITVERLQHHHSAFHPNSSCFDDGTNTPEIALDHQEGLYHRIGIPLDRGKQLGYGALGLTYAFQHACPDNCLPLLWWAETSSFTPLFDR